jgi:putative spermidine/putrescine transport system ATP-binding protein
MSTLKINTVSKEFQGQRALDKVSLTIETGEFVSLLGPSGCGKTTLLRCVAGLEAPSSGSIHIDDEDVTSLPPEKRRLGMMFQSYALFPHMTVLDNVRFGLRMLAQDSRDAQFEKARAALDIIRMSHLAERMPSQLSGGQQQRVALARAIAHEPRLLLLDEPLSNLDARLREDMQLELVRLHKSLGLTTIFVTHDQEEAMTLSDRVVLLREGQVEQIGKPEDIYSAPATQFAADFLGASNMLPGSVTGKSLTLAGASAALPPPGSGAGQEGAGVVMVRQEDIVVNPPNESAFDTCVPVEITARAFRGSTQVYVMRLGDAELRAVSSARDQKIQTGPATACWSSARTTWFAS